LNVLSPDDARQAMMRAELERIAGHEGLSDDVYEILSKALAGRSLA
jgi:hypothetical protein